MKILTPRIKWTEKNVYRIRILIGEAFERTGFRWLACGAVLMSYAKSLEMSINIATHHGNLHRKTYTGSNFFHILL